MLPGGPTTIRWGIDHATYHAFAPLFATDSTHDASHRYTLVVPHSLTIGLSTPRIATLVSPTGHDISIPVTDLFLSNVSWLSSVSHADELKAIAIEPGNSTMQSLLDFVPPVTALDKQTSIKRAGCQRHQRLRKRFLVASVSVVCAITIFEVVNISRSPASQSLPTVAKTHHPVVTAPIRVNATQASNQTSSSSVAEQPIGVWHASELYEVPAHSVALTFDDGPSDYTEKILAVLKRDHVTASFFFIGNRVSRWPTAVRDVAAYGAEVGDHSETHPDLENLAPAEQMAQIADAEKAIQSVDGDVPITLFRPPYGAFDKETFQVLDDLHMNMALWNRDPRDWDNKTSAQIYQAVVDGNPSGGVFDLHETAATFAALPDIIQALQNQGLTLVTLSGAAKRDLPSLHSTNGITGKNAAENQSG